MPLQRLETTAGERVPGSLERFDSAVNYSLQPAIAIARYAGVRSAGLVVNEFRGDLSLFSSGVEIPEDRSGIPVLGVVPFHDLRIAEEHAVALDREWKVETSSDLDIAVAKLPRISNFDDFEPLENESGTSVRYVGRDDELGNPDVVILPGTKSTIADLEFPRGSGLADAVVRHHRAGGRVIGISGGFQMLGTEIHDPDGAESRSPSARGLELLDAVTVFAPAKQTSQVRAVFCEGTGLLADLGGVEIDAYDIHMGKTEVRESPLLRIQRMDSGDCVIADGTVSDDGRVIGTYMHGLFDDPRVRAALRSWIGAKPVAMGIHSREFRQEQYDALAALLRKTLRLDKIKAAMGF